MKKVLVVEDNADNLLLTTCALRRAGYEAISARTGEEGVALAIRERPFFVIMDIDLPGIDGLEATRRIRAAEKDDRVPIVAVTSFAMCGDRDKMLRSGCTAYFEKPIDPLTIVDRIHEAIGVKGE